jgi:hypothetical protein
MILPSGAVLRQALTFTNCHERLCRTGECLFVNAVVVEVAWPASAPPYHQGSSASRDLMAASFVHDHCTPRHERQRILAAEST